MKKKLRFLFLFALVAFVFSSCKKDDPTPEPTESDANGFYFINYGSSGIATITKFDYDSSEVINNYYEVQNDVELTSNVQYAYEYNNKIYMMGNGPDQVIVLDSMFVQSVSGITDNIHNPRYCVGNGDYLYISCLGENPDWNLMPDSYIAKFNVNTNTVEETIALPGGPEGLAVANGKLFVALNYKDSIGVIDLSSEEISYIATPAVTSYFVKDENKNLYVTLESTYSDYSETTGLGYINTSNNTIDNVYQLPGISAGYSSIVAPNSDSSIIYVVASSWVQLDDQSWVQQGAIYSFNTATKEFTPFLENLTGTNGIFVDPRSTDGNIYVFGGESYSEPGTVAIYTPDATYVDEFDCGISPYWAIYLNYDE